MIQINIELGRCTSHKRIKVSPLFSYDMMYHVLPVETVMYIVITYEQEGLFAVVIVTASCAGSTFGNLEKHLEIHITYFQVIRQCKHMVE